MSERSQSRAPSNKRLHPKKKRGHASPPASKAGTLLDPAFKERVERLDKLMQLVAATPEPQAPPGFTLVKKEEPGTLQQVGREADAAWAGVKRIMQLLNVEEKYVDYNSATNVNYTGVLIDLAASISQGVGRAQRTGDSVKITRISVKMVMANGGANSAWTAVIGKSKDAQPGLSDVWDLSGATSARGGLSFPNHYEAQANKVLHREHGYVISGGGVGNMVAERREFSCELKDHHVVFSPATTTTLSGAIWLSAITDLNATVPVLSYMVRVYFVDN